MRQYVASVENRNNELVEDCIYDSMLNRYNQAKLTIRAVNTAKPKSSKMEISNSFFLGSTVLRPKHNSHCYVNLNAVYRPMVDPKFSVLTSTSKFQKLALVKDYQELVVGREEDKMEKAMSLEEQIAKVKSED